VGHHVDPARRGLLLADASRSAQLYTLEPFATKNAAHHLMRTYSGAVAHFSACSRTMDEPQTAGGISTSHWI
jgi:hypothetical protein